MSPVGRRVRRLGMTLVTIRVRLTLWYTAILGGMLLAFGAFLYFSFSANLHAELDRTLLAEAHAAAATLDIEDGQPELDSGLGSVLPGTVVALYDQNGARLVADGTREPPPLPADALAQATRGQQTIQTVRLSDGAEWRTVTLPLSESGGAVEVLQVSRSERDIEVALDQLVRLLMMAIPLTLLLAVAGGLTLAQRALAPIDRIARTADEIEAEDLSRRLDGAASRDELGRLAATFNGMLDRLERAFQRERQFVADASHELRTPVAMLSSQVDIALARKRTVAEYRRALTELQQDIARIGQLLSELLSLSRADAGQEDLIPERLALAELVDDVVATMEPLAEQRGVKLSARVQTPVTIEGDQARLTQLLVNLVDNGLKYTPGGGTVTVAVGQDAGRAVLRVADTGVGIAAEHLPNVFERFYRVDKARARADGGVGLGLAISRSIVRAHGGEIAVESRPGQGTTFTVYLPLATDRTRAPGPKSARSRWAIPHAPRQSTAVDTGSVLSQREHS